MPQVVHWAGERHGLHMTWQEEGVSHTDLGHTERLHCPICAVEEEFIC